MRLLTQPSQPAVAPGPDSRCIACQNDAATQYFAGADWSVNRCVRCGLAWVVDSPSPEVLRGGVPLPWRGELEDRAHLHMYADRVRRVERIAPPRRRWLDIGCGGGGLISSAARRGYTVEGIEPGPGAVWARDARSLPVQRGYLADAIGWLRDEPFDVVSYFHVLEHVRDPEHELGLAREVTAPGGILLVEVPRFDSLSWQLMKQRHRHFLHHHRWYFTRAALESLLGRSRFEVQLVQRVPYYISAGWLLYRLGLTEKIPRPLLASFSALPLRVDLGDISLVVARRT